VKIVKSISTPEQDNDLGDQPRYEGKYTGNVAPSLAGCGRTFKSNLRPIENKDTQMLPENRRRRQPPRQRELDTSMWTEEERATHLQKVLLKTPLAEMDLPVRVINTLEENNVIWAEHLMTQTYESLMAMKNFGDKTLEEVKEAMRKLGLKPPAWVKPPKPKKAPKPRAGKGGKGALKLW
jgi:hypothetical protein